MSYIVRKMNREEVDMIVEWAAREGWNPGLHDASCFYATDPNGFFIGLLDDTPIACVSAVAYDRKFGFLGFYIVRKEFRGKGYGLKIWREALNYLSTQNIGLDGVLSQVVNYQKEGFKQAYLDVRYGGIAQGKTAGFKEIVKLDSTPFAEVEKYDRKFFPAGRSKFLRCWISQPESLALGILVDNKLAGYGVIRRCYSGYKIGPLFADNADVAEKLYLSLCSWIPRGEEIFLDVPQVNKAAVDLAKKHEMEKVFAAVRMYSRKIPDLPLDQIFGVTSFELG